MPERLSKWFDRLHRRYWAWRHRVDRWLVAQSKMPPTDTIWDETLTTFR
jgi:hypothetical protein